MEHQFLLRIIDQDFQEEKDRMQKEEQNRKTLQNSISIDSMCQSYIHKIEQDVNYYFFGIIIKQNNFSLQNLMFDVDSDNSFILNSDDLTEDVSFQKSTNAQSAPKYTCRYEILIENDKDFQVARKIIGSKGCNMKKIIDQCTCNSVQAVKLRLRGKGSGYKEGPSRQESNEPLHLCISSKSVAMFEKACQLVEVLLQKIYNEYKLFHGYKGKKPSQNFYRKLINYGNTKNPKHPTTLNINYRYDFPSVMSNNEVKILLR